jgi:O-antigen biosynthesis protein WbqP
MALIASAFLVVPMAFIAMVIKGTSRGPVLHWSKRIGRNNVVFLMPKFRSMRVETPQLATHLLQRPEAYVTPVGAVLRRASLDELPQLYSILKGDLSFVGPRPALFNQDDLMALRRECGIDALIPGLTGWAQINGRDELTIQRKVEFEREYLRRRSFLFDLKILIVTFERAVFGRGVRH